MEDIVSARARAPSMQPYSARPTSLPRAAAHRRPRVVARSPDHAWQFMGEHKDIGNRLDQSQ